MTHRSKPREFVTTICKLPFVKTSDVDLPVRLVSPIPCRCDSPLVVAQQPSPEPNLCYHWAWTHLDHQDPWNDPDPAYSEGAPRSLPPGVYNGPHGPINPDGFRTAAECVASFIRLREQEGLHKAMQESLRMETIRNAPLNVPPPTKMDPKQLHQLVDQLLDQT